MHSDSVERIRAIWRQSAIPVIYRKGAGHPLLVRLPYQEGNRAWLKQGRRHEPKWDSEKKHWEIPKAWFNDIVKASLLKWGKVYIIQLKNLRENEPAIC